MVVEKGTDDEQQCPEEERGYAEQLLPANATILCVHQCLAHRISVDFLHPNRGNPGLHRRARRFSYGLFPYMRVHIGAEAS
mgnify:CR=1 FL=1